MINLSKFLHTESGRIIMSMILGFGLATIFRMTCKDRSCIIFKAPEMDEIEDKIFKHNGSCYKYKYTTHKCNENEEIVGL